MGDLISFPARSDAAPDRLAAITEKNTDVNDLASSLGSPDEWAASAIVYLKGKSVSAGGRVDGQATVSRASLHLLLAYVERLEAPAAMLAQAVKQTLDPHGRIGPGVLGF